MSKGKTSISGRIVCGVMAFLLSVFMLVAIMLPILYFTILSPMAFTNAFKSSGYYATVLEHSVDLAGASLIPTGFPESVLDGVVTEEDVKVMLNGKVYDTFAKEDRVLLEARMHETMMENMYAYMDENGISRDIVSTEGLEDIATTIISGIETNVSFPLISRIRGYMDTYVKLAVIGVIVCVGLAVLLCKLIHSLSIWKHVYQRNIAFATGGTSLMLLVLPVCLVVWGGYKRITMPEYLYNFIQKLAGNTLWSFIICGILLLAITVVLVVLSEKGRKRARHRRRERTSTNGVSQGLPEL